jgi:uncharacterized protein involved in response to NO
VTLFSYAFRPFFLLAAAWAPLALLALYVALSGMPWPADAWPVFRWHGHEMLFGFVAAAIAGFLLTAVPTWTSSTPVTGMPLAGLAGLWVAGRVVVSPLFGLQASPAAWLELLFYPALIVTVGIVLVRTRNRRNYPFLLMLTLLFVADLLFHGLHEGWIERLPFDPLRLTANLVMLMIVVVGGRIIPLFTRNALIQRSTAAAIAPQPRLEPASLAAVAAVIVGDVLMPDTTVAGVLAAVAALLIAARLSRWHGIRARRMPIVIILHIGYAWLVVALALKAVWLLAGVPWAANWLHALTAGAFGTMILAVTTRVALGHTGRPIVATRSIIVAYFLVTLGAMLRVWGAFALPGYYLHVMACAMALWAGGFVIFLLAYGSILTGPRVEQ